MAKKRPPKRGPGTPTVGVQPEKQEFLFQTSIAILILLIYGFYLGQQINLAPVDLGRHLKNGELFFQDLFIPKTNLYSYTYPDYPFVDQPAAASAIKDSAVLNVGRASTGAAITGSATSQGAVR